MRQQLEKQSSLVSQFTFVDLAGSEKLDREVDEARLAEAKHINKSLSALGTVIQALKMRQQTSTGGHLKIKKSSSNESSSIVHIPYRDCKLTHLLKTCFNDGNSLMHLIICLSPS